MKELIVENNDNIRLDSYIANENSDLSRAVIQKLLEEGNILVNDVIKKSSYKVKKGDVIKIEVPEPKESKIEAQDIPIEIVYEDIEVKEYLFGCNFNRHETILPLLEVLESTGTVHFKIEDKKIIVSK